MASKTALRLAPLLAGCLALVAPVALAKPPATSTASAFDHGAPHALVIGNAAYAKGELANPERDAALIAARLTAAGFRVTHRSNLGKAALTEAVTTFSHGLKAGDVALFYYAGHGIELRGKNYLLGVDFDADDEDDAELLAYPVEHLLRKLERASVSMKIVILDACRDDPFTRGWSRSVQSRGFARISVPQGTYLAYASAPGKTAADGAGSKQGPFATALAEHLLTPGLSLETAFRRVKRAVAAATGNQQDPYTENNVKLDAFYLVSPPSAAASVAPRATPLRPATPAVTAAAASQLPEGFARIDAGSFLMGSPASEAERYDDEGPQHRVTITRPFLLQTTEVTQGQWQALMGNNPSHFSACGASCPVEQVSWWDAASYCNSLSRKEGLPECYELQGCNGKQAGTGGKGTALKCTGVEFKGLSCSGYRLPTESEWEYAARAGTTAARHGDLDAAAWHTGNSASKTHAVATKQANAWGLHDMVGNVWEWTWDWKRDYSSSAVQDPIGSGGGAGRVGRGGSWTNEARRCRSAFRFGLGPAYRYSGLGFRPARSLP